MASSNRRERELAQKKRERQLAKRKSGSRKFNRNVISAVFLISVLLIVLIYAFSQSSPSDVQASPTPSSTYVSQCDAMPTPASSPKQWETPPPVDTDSGKYLWTLTTNCGDIVIEIDAKLAPVTASSMRFLSENSFFNGSACHRLTTSGIFVLQCGDPLGTGAGSSGYRIIEENLPTTNPALYATGEVAMANSGQPQTSGSQFFIVFQDTQLAPTYTKFGKVVQGMDILQLVASAGVIGGSGDGTPNQSIGIISTTFEKTK